MLTEGLITIIIGMSMVFLFLAILVGIIYCLKFFIKFFPMGSKSSSLKKSENLDSVLEEIAVAVAAIKKSMKK